MDYQIREGVVCIKAELRKGKMSIRRGENHVIRLRTSDENENSMRVFAHNNTMFIKQISANEIDFQLEVPDSVKILELKSESTGFELSNMELDNVKITAAGDLILENVTIKKSCQLITDNSEINLAACDISSMNIQLFNGKLNFGNTVLHGNSTAYVVNSTVGGLLKGALVDYVLSAGSGISPRSVIVNDHMLSEFPNRKNVQDCAWLLLAGSLTDTAHIKIAKPRISYYQ